MDFLPLQYSYFPKKEAFDFRKAVSVQPWDLVKYMSLVLLCAEEIESKKPHKNTDIVFSYRSNQETAFFLYRLCLYALIYAALISLNQQSLCANKIFYISCFSPINLPSDCFFADTDEFPV